MDRRANIVAFLLAVTALAAVPIGVGGSIKFQNDPVVANLLWFGGWIFCFVFLGCAVAVSVWPPSPGLTENSSYLPIHKAARDCFDETALLSNWSLPGTARMRNIICHMVMEAKNNPELLSLWGVRPPSLENFQRIPAEDLDWERMNRSDGMRIEVADNGQHWVEWDSVSVLKSQLPLFIERLKSGDLPGQQIPKWTDD